MSKEDIKKLRRKLEDFQFSDRVVLNPNRKKIKIINQTSDEIIADIDYVETVEEEGTAIDANTMNTFTGIVKESYDNADTALLKAEEALRRASNGLGTLVIVGDEEVETFYADEKAERDAKNLLEEDIASWREKLQIFNLPIGMIIPSAFYQDNINLHLLDGTEINKDGSYSNFYQWVKNNIDKVPHYENDNNRTALEKYKDDIDNYGQCGKFVITDTYVKLPTITEFIASNNGGQPLGLAQLDEFKSHTHTQNEHNHTIFRSGNGGGAWTGIAGSPSNEYAGNYKTSGVTATNNNTGGSETRPKNIRYPYYIVVGNKSNELVEVNTESVRTTGNQVISGIKNFEDGILVPDLEV